MTEMKEKATRVIRWWPVVVLIFATIIGIAWVRLQTDWPFQKRNLTTAQILIIAAILLVLWWTFLSQAPKRLRLAITFALLGTAMIGAALFRVRGVSGDLLPIVEFRWGMYASPQATTKPASQSETNSFTSRTEFGFPQFRGPNRDGILANLKLDTNWIAHPPEILWRQKIGAAWSGFVVVGQVCITQEQRDSDELVTAYALQTGAPVWTHTNSGHYDTVIAGEGPRATPTVSGDRVFVCGATGILNCLDLTTGKLIWTRDVVKDSDGKIPQWGYTCSPLIVDDLVVVHGGEEARHSVLAYRVADGSIAWQAGNFASSYSSLSFATLAETPQILAFNHGSVSGHDPTSGAVLWQRPWGNGNVVCASPVVISTNYVLFSSGYGVGAELLEISRVSSNRLSARLIWKSIRMKSKFAHMFARDGFLYGLDDGILACVDLANGSQRWKEGRYGHGQGLLAGEHYLLMSESGELVLLRPTSVSPNEIARFRVFDSKTWNPIALSGDLLLVRNDREAACLRLTRTPK